MLFIPLVFGLFVLSQFLVVSHATLFVALTEHGCTPGLTRGCIQFVFALVFYQFLLYLLLLLTFRAVSLSDLTFTLRACYQSIALFVTFHLMCHSCVGHVPLLRYLCSHLVSHVDSQWAPAPVTQSDRASRFVLHSHLFPVAALLAVTLFLSFANRHPLI